MTLELTATLNIDWLPAGERGRLLLHRRLTGPECPAVDRFWLSAELLWHRLAALDPATVHRAEADLWAALVTGGYVGELDRPVPLSPASAVMVRGILRSLLGVPRPLGLIAARLRDRIGGPALGPLTATFSRHDFLATALMPLIDARLDALNLRHRPGPGIPSPSAQSPGVKRPGAQSPGVQRPGGQSLGGGGLEPGERSRELDAATDDELETRHLGGDREVLVNRLVAYPPHAATALDEAVRRCGVQDGLAGSPADRVLDGLAACGWRFWSEPLRLMVARPLAELLDGLLFLQVRHPGKAATYAFSPRPALAAALRDDGPGSVPALLCPATGTPPSDADLHRALGALLAETVQSRLV